MYDKEKQKIQQLNALFDETFRQKRNIKVITSIQKSEIMEQNITIQKLKMDVVNLERRIEWGKEVEKEKQNQEKVIRRKKDGFDKEKEAIIAP